MDTRQLEVYIAAAQHLNFTEASRHLNMVPSAVSHNIGMLEKELDEKLFVRVNNRLTLTAFGESFLEEAIKITTIANNVMSKKPDGMRSVSDILKIGCVFPEFILKYEPAFSDFCKLHPDVSVRYNQYDSISLVRKLADQQLDAAFGRESTFKSFSHIGWKSLYKDPFKLLLRKDHPLAKEERITVPMLRQETVITMNRSSNPGMFDMVTHLFFSNKITPLLNDQSNHHLTTIMLASMGRGVVIIPYLNICYAKLPPEIVCKEIDDPLAYHEIGIAWNTKSDKPIVKSFIDTVLDYNKELLLQSC